MILKFIEEIGGDASESSVKRKRERAREREREGDGKGKGERWCVVCSVVREFVD